MATDIDRLDVRLSRIEGVVTDTRERFIRYEAQSVANLEAMCAEIARIDARSKTNDVRLDKVEITLGEVVIARISKTKLGVAMISAAAVVGSAVGAGLVALLG